MLFPHHHLCQSINSAVSVCTVCFYLEASLVLSVSVLFSLHFSVITVAVKWCQRTDSSCQTPKQTGMSRSTETINNREAEINTVPQWPRLRKPECLQPCWAFVMWCGTDVSALSLPVHITAYQHPSRWYKSTMCNLSIDVQIYVTHCSCSPQLKVETSSFFTFYTLMWSFINELQGIINNKDINTLLNMTTKATMN